MHPKSKHILSHLLSQVGQTESLILKSLRSQCIPIIQVVVLAVGGGTWPSFFFFRSTLAFSIRISASIVLPTLLDFRRTAWRVSY